MLSGDQSQAVFSLQAGPTWPSFEKFRAEGAKALNSVNQGVVATLHTKTGQYRILEEQDFQKMYGLARDVDRLRSGLRVVALAVRAAQKNPVPENLDLLAEAVAMVGSLPELPTRSGFAPLVPEGLELEQDDEVILNPDQIERPLQAGNFVLESNLS